MLLKTAQMIIYLKYKNSTAFLNPKIAKHLRGPKLNMNPFFCDIFEENSFDMTETSHRQTFTSGTQPKMYANNKQ